MARRAKATKSFFVDHLVPGVLTKEQGVKKKEKENQKNKKDLNISSRNSMTSIYENPDKHG